MKFDSWLFFESNCLNILKQKALKIRHLELTMRPLNEMTFGSQHFSNFLITFETISVEIEVSSINSNDVRDDICIQLQFCAN